MKKLIEQYNAYVEHLKYFGDSIYQLELFFFTAKKT
jgi:hypothetical protein